MFGFFKKKEVEIISPLQGEVIDISQVEDQVFSQKMLGDGVAIKPTSDLVVAPCDGKIMQVFPTNHAIGIQSKDGLEILIHIGLDTVELKGQGFTRMIEEGDKVKAGDPLVKLDLDFLAEHAKSVVTPVVITNGDAVEDLNKNINQHVNNNEAIMNVKLA